MFEYTIQYTEEYEISILTDRTDIDELIEENVPCRFMAKFYNQELNVKYIKETVTKKLYIIYTNVCGYNTYDSGVFCAYTKEHCKELAIETSDDFNSNDIHVIGIANEDLEIGEVCASFNAG